MNYLDISGSLVYLAGLVFLFICGLTGLMLITLEFYKNIFKRLGEAERETREAFNGQELENVRAFESPRLSGQTSLEVRDPEESRVYGAARKGTGLMVG